MKRIALAAILTLSLLGCPSESPETAQVSMNVKSLKIHGHSCKYFDCSNCEHMTLEKAQAAGGKICRICRGK